MGITAIRKGQGFVTQELATNQSLPYKGIYHHKHSNYLVTYRNDSNFPRLHPGYINIHNSVQIYSCNTKIHVVVQIYSWNIKIHHNKAWKHLSTPNRQSHGRSWLIYHLQPPCPPVSGLLNTFLKQNIKTFQTVSQSSVHASLYW